MPRRPRVEVQGGVHHVYARGNARQPIYLDDADREIYLQMLGWVTRRTGWCCLAYCLMDNHVHLLIKTPECNLGVGMRLLHGLYAQDFNERRERCGHLFQGRFGSRVMGSDEQLWHTVGYIVRNPVAAGFCRGPEQWRWSSHAATLGQTAPPWLDVPELLRYFATAGGDPRRRYAELTMGA